MIHKIVSSDMSTKLAEFKKPELSSIKPSNGKSSAKSSPTSTQKFMKLFGFKASKMKSKSEHLDKRPAFKPAWSTTCGNKSVQSQSTKKSQTLSNLTGNRASVSLKEATPHETQQCTKNAQTIIDQANTNKTDELSLLSLQKPPEPEGYF